VNHRGTTAAATIAASRRSPIASLGELGLHRDYATSKGCTSPFAPTWIAEMVRRQG